MLPENYFFQCLLGGITQAREFGNYGESRLV